MNFVILFIYIYLVTKYNYNCKVIYNTKSCSLCSEKPLHSFRIIQQTLSHAFFYTNEAEIDSKIKDRTPEFIINHISNELLMFDKDKKWSWFYDSRHYKMDMNTMPLFLGLLNIFKKYGSTLQKIYIIPSDMARTMLSLVSYLLPYYIKNVIVLIE